MHTFDQLHWRTGTGMALFKFTQSVPGTHLTQSDAISPPVGRLRRCKLWITLFDALYKLVGPTESSTPPWKRLGPSKRTWKILVMHAFNHVRCGGSDCCPDALEETAGSCRL